MVVMTSYGGRVLLEHMYGGVHSQRPNGKSKAVTYFLTLSHGCHLGTLDLHTIPPVLLSSIQRDVGLSAFGA